MKIRITVIAFLSCLSLMAQRPWQQIHVDVVYLSSDDLEGRETAARGEKLAAEYISSRMEAIGLEPKGNSKYYQSFDFASNPHEKSVKDKKGTNVIGFLNRNADKTIIIGAHYDHLGFGATGSLAANDHSIHNGADDNASGISSLLWLAEQLSTQKKLGVNVLFIAFSGEELGLIGSKAYCENPVIPMEKVLAMINMDMVGRLKAEKSFAISGTGTAKEWNQLLEKVKPEGFSFTLSESGVGPSDHTSFYLKSIPVLHFFTGVHTDYHKPSDDSPLVNYEGIYQISGIIYNLVLQLSSEPMLSFQKTKDENKEQAAAFKVTLGVMPDYSYSGNGMRVDAVLDDRPAKKAGLLGGDVIVKVGDMDIKDIYAYMKALSNYKKGDKTKVTVDRKGEQLTYEVEF